MKNRQPSTHLGDGHTECPFLLNGKQHFISDFTTQESTKLQSIPMEKIPVKLVLAFKKVNFITQIDVSD